LRSLEGAARSFAIELKAAPVREVAEVEIAMTAQAREPAYGLIVLPDASTAAHHERITSLAARYRVRAVYPYRFFATSGGLISYGVDTVDLYRQVTAYVDRILKGEKPANLPVQMPTKFELVINLQSAKALGLEVPATLLARADEVIE
jgi:putative tryptophan/tyrosine transport system substrate-binding protein